MAKTNLTVPVPSGVMSALFDLDEHLVEAEGLAATWVHLAGEAEGAPEWPYLVGRLVARVRGSADALDREVRRVLAVGGGL